VPAEIARNYGKNGQKGKKRGRHLGVTWPEGKVVRKQKEKKRTSRLRACRGDGHEPHSLERRSCGNWIALAEKGGRRHKQRKTEKRKKT